MVIASAEVLLFQIGSSVPREGDWAVYSVHAVWHSSATDEKVQEAIEYYEDIDDTNWTLTIQKFDYPEAAISIVEPLKNGTNSKSYEGNVETGDPDLSMWIVSANLSEGEPIYRHEADLNITIKSEEPYEFANAIRDVVYTNFNRTESNVISHFGVFWDRETGILSGMSTILEYYDEDSNLMLTAKVDIVIVETNLWTKTAPRQDKTIWPTIVTLIVLLSILVVAVVLFRKRKRKRKVGLRR